MSFIAQNNYSKQDLEACADGNLFTKEGDVRLPSYQTVSYTHLTLQTKRII